MTPSQQHLKKLDNNIYGLFALDDLSDNHRRIIYR